MKRFSYILLSTLAFVLPLIAFSQSERSQNQHTIATIGEFVRGAELGVWTDQDRYILDIGSKSPSRNQACKGLKQGTLGFAENSPVKGTVSNSYPYHAETIDVVLLPSEKEQKREVRGSFTVTLPEVKRVQLELDYDLMQDGAQAINTANFYVEVFEKSTTSPTGWSKCGEFREKPEKKTRELKRVFTMNDANLMGAEAFTSHSYIANLSQWAGREVQISLVAESSTAGQGFVRGRWVQARLVGCTFDFKIVPIREEDKG